MPCPERFRESLTVFGVDEAVTKEILEGYEELKGSSPKALRAEFFRRALEILDEKVPPEQEKALLMWGACCKSGARDKASRAFLRDTAGLTVAERVAKLAEQPATNMGVPELSEDGTLLLHAVSWWDGGRYACACSNFSRLKDVPAVSKQYCCCCGGHFQHHYQRMLGVKLELLEVVSSPLDSGGASPCVFRFRILPEEA